jgi:hypothetical protein
MNQSLDLIQDLDFSTAIDSTETIVGGLSIACLHDEHDKGGRWGGCFPHPRPPVHPIRPIDVHPLPFPLPRPIPFPGPKHFPDFVTVDGPGYTTNH